MRLCVFSLTCVLGLSGLSIAPLAAQQSIQLFSPVDVRPSQSGAGLGSSAVTFNTTTLSLSCPATPVAVLASTASAVPSSSTGNVLVDNDLDVTNLTTNVGPTNVCTGNLTAPGQSSDLSCFTSGYQTPAGNGQDNGLNPDTLTAIGGVAPINISSFLIAGQQQIKIDLVDDGGYVASSSIYLNTNCTSGGVVGPATISGNTIPPTSPTMTQLDQSFTFDTTTNQVISFEYNLAPAQSANTLTINSNGVNPQVGDSGLEPLAAYPAYVSGTSFATSICLIHDGELLNGVPACKLYTLQCTTGTGADATGAQCPVSTLSNEVLNDIFDGPPFTLQDIPTPAGPTFHEGLGLLMASEGWQGGPCTFDQASGLENLPCPQNLLISFSGPGVYASSGQTTHPNSTFISIAQVPEALTTVTLTDHSGNPVIVGPGNWSNNPNPYIQLTSQPPTLTGAALPAVANFLASPIQSITYGISTGTTPPAPGTTTSSDIVLSDPSGCPSQPVSVAPPYTAPLQSFSNLADGNYLVHYYAKDCAGTEELKFLQDLTGSWSTNFYTYPINIDTVPPAVATGPVLSPAGPYYPGESVSATYSCTDDRSGVVQCGSQSFGAGVLDTGTITTMLPNAAPGTNTFTVVAVDAAGNTSSKSVSYSVAADSQIQFTLSSGNVVYPQGTDAMVKLTTINGHVPTGNIKIMDGTKVLASFDLNGGAAHYYLRDIPAGTHELYAAYAGDKNNPAGDSAPVTLVVQPVPVQLSVSCWNTPYPYGANFFCGVYASSAAGPPVGSITYSLDGGSPVSLKLLFGAQLITIQKPAVGNHKLVINFAAQTNYAAAPSYTENFTVTPAPVYVALTPSAWYLTGGNLTLTASVQSWSAGPPNAIGAVTFSYGNTVLATVPVNAKGVASTTFAANSLPYGPDTLTATYEGTNYATSSTSITITVGH
jgi:hypothetical protein